MQIVLMYSDRSRAVLYLLSNFIHKITFTVFSFANKRPHFALANYLSLRFVVIIFLSLNQ